MRDADDSFAAIARTLARPEVGAATAIDLWQKDTHDVDALAAELGRQVDAVNGGDLSRAEAMLIAQAHTLDAMFVNLARRAVGQDYLKQWEAYMRMAMKAQNQCRMTLETLAAIKNPPVVFARQANINNGGQQQVNNGVSAASAQPHERAHAANSQTENGEVLEASDGQRLDTRATGAAVSADPHMEAVGKGDRPAKRRRQGASRAQR
jgi:hypothetical protein